METLKEIDAFIKKIIAKKPDFDEGKKAIMDALKKFIPEYNPNSLKTVDFDRTLIEFENWLVQTITNDPLPSSVKSIWIGLFDGSKDETGATPEIQMCIKGSKYLPDLKPNDWFKNDLWDASGKNSEIKAFKTISNTLKNFPNDSVYIQNVLMLSLVLLLCQNGFDIIQHEFLIYQKELFIGCGFEAGPQYVVGKLTENGVNLIKQ
jgi:hypothetical protein